MNADDSAAQLQQLRDIHLPPPTSWWPPAPGWWVLATASLLIFAALAIWLWRRRVRNRYRRAALQQLSELRSQWQRNPDDRALIESVNRLLKQVALTAYPRQRVAALTGPDWLVFLDSGRKQPRFTEPARRALAAAYQAQPQPVAAETLFAAADYWIRRHRC